MQPWRHRDLTYVLQVLRDFGVVYRAASSGASLWKPKPQHLPEHVQMLLKEYSPYLAIVMCPSPPLRPVGRPYWTQGEIHPCVCCHSSCVTVDPLGQPRHVWCGWLRQ